MIVLYLIMILYFLVIIALIYGFSKVKKFQSADISPKTKFSIIVPFRNEAAHLPLLLKSLSELHYPMHLFEVFLVNDASTDGFEMPCCEFKTTVLNNRRISNAPKKDALLTAIQVIKTEWIVSTDADCVVNPNWLKTLDCFIQNKNPEMIVGAVTYKTEASFLHHFQQLYLASLQGATMGSFGIKIPFMCNGANFAYTKSLFEKLNGFEGNATIASGDDVFLLQKAIANFPEKVCYLKSEKAIVVTKPLDNWNDLWFQSVRWASKTTSYQSRYGQFLGLVVFGGNFCWLLGLGFFLSGMITFKIGFPLLMTKFLIDGILIYSTNLFLKTPTRHLIFGSLLYPFFSVSVALYSVFFGSYEWKGRRFTK